MRKAKTESDARGHQGRRVGVLVLGMHRSGTSALSRMLNLSGCSLPATLMAASEGNQRGHWESEAIALFNNELLDSAGTSWDDCQKLDPAWYDSLVAPGFRERAKGMLRQEFGTSPLFVFKDPRNCRLGQFWLEAMELEGITPAVIIPIRSPQEVAGSLERRDLTEEGYGLLMWLRHVLDAERASRGRKRVFTTYRQLMIDWRLVRDTIAKTFEIVFPRQTAATDRQIDAFLEQRSLEPDRMPQPKRSANLSAWIATTHAIMLRWCGSGEDVSDYSVLDQIRAEFDEAAGALASVLVPSLRAGPGPGEGERLRADLEARLNEARDELAGTHEQLALQAVQAEELTQLNSAVDQLRESLAQREQRIAEMEGEVGQLLARLETREQDLSVLAATHDDRLRDLSSQLAVALSTIRQREEEAEQRLGALQAGANEGRLILEQRIQELDGDVVRLLGDLDQIHAARARSERNIAWLQALNATLLEEPGWWGLLPRPMRKRKRCSRLLEMGLFDGAAYSRRYPDVELSGADPLVHYVVHGMAEGRQM